MSDQKWNTLADWCIKRHADTNHYYDTYLPYEFHLRMVAQVAEDFEYLLTVKDNRTDIVRAAWGHDLIEDARTSYNDVKDHLGQGAADIIYAVTNEKGKNRKERANDKYYAGIRDTQGAVFVKLCDRIANVQYSKMTKSRMFEMYKLENDHFCHAIGYTPFHELTEMFNYLEKLFEN